MKNIEKNFFDGGIKLPEIEERVLEFWEKEKIFEKCLEKTKNSKPFTFYDGPPFATGLPHYGHILSSTIKDVVGRYQTMRGRYVRRRWGWDCHGLPIEEIVERKLGISGKKDIEKLGIEKFNAACRSAVLEYAAEWKKMVRRIARWVEFDTSYKTMDRDYMESVWWAFKQAHDKGLVYEGRKVLLYCPRCETPISNFEVAMDNSYRDVKEDAVTVKFKIKNPGIINLQNQNAHLLSWTTTPWTLPGNVALAVNIKTKYGVVRCGKEHVIAAVDRLKDLNLLDQGASQEFTGQQLVGLEYEPLFDVPAVRVDNDKAFKVYPADFVNTNEGTGIVHTAVVYGEEDYELGLKVGLPVVPLLDEKGKFNDKAPEFLRGKYFKDSEAAIVADLEKRDLLFAKSPHTHSYPHCWRCEAMLYYNAIPAWFVNVQKIKRDLLKTNSEEINWFPAHLKHGRYEKSVEQAPDWNISRNRYWGNPIPVWKCESCGKIKVVGSIRELGLSANTFYFVRHGISENIVRQICSSYQDPDPIDLVPEGVAQVEKLAEQLKAQGGVDVIVSSDMRRTKHTAEIISKALGCPVKYDPRLREFNVGAFSGRPASEFDAAFPRERRWVEAPDGGETWKGAQARMVAAVQDINREYRNKKILIISHGDPLRLLQQYFGSERGLPDPAELFSIDVSAADIHRPQIDEVEITCECGGRARRIKEIFDSWFEAGSMPFAEYHYPFENKNVFESRLPAQFVAEYIAQTRAWFYVMHVISLVLFGKAPFENVVTTGTILAEDGLKLSKSKKNFPDPWGVINKHGVDSLRFYLMNSVVMQAENLNFSIRDLESVYRKVALILSNVCNYFLTYAREAKWRVSRGRDLELAVLDRWINARTQELVNAATENLDGYDTVHATRAIERYIDDLSTWYVRRSRGRKDEAFFATLYGSLMTASKVIAPIMPYIAEVIYRALGGEFGNGEGQPVSVHLSDWPARADIADADLELLRDMETVRSAASLGLAERKSLGIPVRQPLPALKLKAANPRLKAKRELLVILAEEVNVKEIVFDEKLRQDAALDVSLTPELRDEGLVRALERVIQEARKKEGLKVGEYAALLYATDDEDVKRAIGRFNREKTYISAVNESEESAALKSCDIGGKKISFRLERKGG